MPDAPMIINQQASDEQFKIWVTNPDYEPKKSENDEGEKDKKRGNLFGDLRKGMFTRPEQELIIKGYTLVSGLEMEESLKKENVNRKIKLVLKDHPGLKQEDIFTSGVLSDEQKEKIKEAIRDADFNDCKNSFLSLIYALANSSVSIMDRDPLINKLTMSRLVHSSEERILDDRRKPPRQGIMQRWDK